MDSIEGHSNLPVNPAWIDSQQRSDLQSVFGWELFGKRQGSFSGCLDALFLILKRGETILSLCMLKISESL